MKRIFLIILYTISAILLYPIVSYSLTNCFPFLKYALIEIPYQGYIQVFCSSPILLIIGIYLIVKYKSYNRIIGIVLSSIAFIWLFLLVREVLIAYP